MPELQPQTSQDKIYAKRRDQNEYNFALRKSTMCTLNLQTD